MFKLIAGMTAPFIGIVIIQTGLDALGGFVLGAGVTLMAQAWHETMTD